MFALLEDSIHVRDISESDRIAIIQQVGILVSTVEPPPEIEALSSSAYKRISESNERLYQQALTELQIQKEKIINQLPSATQMKIIEILKS